MHESLPSGVWPRAREGEKLILSVYLQIIHKMSQEPLHQQQKLHNPVANDPIVWQLCTPAAVSALNPSHAVPCVQSAGHLCWCN